MTNLFSSINVLILTMENPPNDYSRIGWAFLPTATNKMINANISGSLKKQNRNAIQKNYRHYEPTDRSKR
ncbi:MAG: hypothetical protein IKI11_01850 [Neisseriaceae bacterium]|nr:hypothetical protein [Neisseriaceae bacterium]